ncbi:CBS domain-containing protein [Aestuariimicrobium ganziense]|uniref:CBS domain-containing protein n=1 Tax=Aestuariimicrobium ganziense TaxID=2773677 RepID=UPI0019425B1B|nr:CBS domain-containing protein [Aestuariimicrobium ganziense]
MRVQDILAKKGSAVLTLPSSAPVAELLATLADNQVGAVVIIEDDQVVGIASERDVVRHLRDGAANDTPVSALMTTEVVSCCLADEIQSLAETMTNKRFRHLPVVEEGRLVGIVSIGDVVKNRLDELTNERDHLSNYLHG